MRNGTLLVAALLFSAATLWGASLQGHVDKVSFWYGRGADTITYRCKVEMANNADMVTLTV